MLKSVITSLCEKIASKLEKRIIYREDGVPYLERYYILHSNDTKYLPGIYLHKFLSSDEDVELHDHPWSRSFSIILTGGYHEQRRYTRGDGKSEVITHCLTPGSFNLIEGTTFHRIELIENSAWTLFFSGDKKREWGFWHPDTHQYTHWKEFIEQKKSAL